MSAQVPPPKGIIIGSRFPADDAGPTLWTDDPNLRPHVDRAWMRAYAAAHSGLPAQLLTSQPGGPFLLPDWALERHTCLFGATGGGKSRLALHLVSEHLQQGGSALILEPKSQTIAHLLDRCRRAGLTPEQITVLDPANPEVGVPGWNPLLAGLPPAQSAADLVSILRQNSESWGPRLSDILANAFILLGAHRLSLYEVPRLLTRPDYRMALLKLPLPSGAALNKRTADRQSANKAAALGVGSSVASGTGGAAVSEARDYFLYEYSSMARSEQVGAAAPVLTRVRSLLGSDFLQPLLCAARNTLDLASLWQSPGVVLVHLDRTSLGDEGARLLGGLLAHQIYRTALRSPGPVPVLLALDELGAQERFIGSALIDIVTVGRSQNLRLLAATQHLAGLSPELRAALLANAGVQASFQTGYDDARLLAASFAVGADDTLSGASLSVASHDRATGQPVRTTCRHPVRDGQGHVIRLSGAAWTKLRRHEATAPPGKETSLKEVQSLAAEAGIPRLYVHAADTDKPIALSKYVQGLSQDDYWFDGPAPLELIVSFPRPKFTSVRRSSATDLSGQWTRDIHRLPTQQAVVRVRGSDPEIIRIVDVETSDGSASHAEWTVAARRAGAQSWEEITATAKWRRDQVDQVAAGNGTLPGPVNSDVRVDGVVCSEGGEIGQTIPPTVSRSHETPSDMSSRAVLNKTTPSQATEEKSKGISSRERESLSHDREDTGSNPGSTDRHQEPQRGEALVGELQTGNVLTNQNEHTIQREVDEDGSIA